MVCCEADSSRVKIIDFGLARKITPGMSVKVQTFVSEPECISFMLIVELC